MSTTVNDGERHDAGYRPRRPRAQLALLGVGLAVAGAGFATVTAAPAFAQRPATTAAVVAVQRDATPDPASPGSASPDSTGSASKDVHETAAVTQRERANHERSSKDTTDASTPDRQRVHDAQDG